MSYRSLLPAALISSLFFVSAAQAGHSDPTVRLGVDVIWGGGHSYPVPVAWYPAPVYSYAPPPVYGQPYWARGHRHHGHRHHYRHDDRHDRWDDDRHHRRHRDD